MASERKGQPAREGERAVWEIWEIHDRTLPHLHSERIPIEILRDMQFLHTICMVYFFLQKHPCHLCVSVSFSNATVRISNLLVCP